MESQSAEATQPARVLIADDYPLICDALCRAIESTSDLTVVGLSSDAEEALKAIESLHPDIVILSLRLPGASGYELLRRMKLDHPDVAALAFSIQSDSAQAAQALRAGAKGYISKKADIDNILAAIRHILTGRIFVSQDFMPNLLDRYFGAEPTHDNIKKLLTKRELQIFQMIGSGVTTKQIAEQLFISQRTVESHRDHIKVKLDVDDVFKLHQMAFEWVQEELALGK